MKWSYVCPLLGLVMFACATEENDFPSPSELTTGNDDAGGSAGSGGASGSNFGGSSSGTFASGGAGASGTGTGGSTSFGGSASFGGTFGTSGTFGGGGKAAGGAANGGASGSGGRGGAGGSGGKANGGAGGGGGKANGGAGGGGNTLCNGTIPAKGTWKGSALRVAAGDPVARAFDGDDATRFSTGMQQMGDEWLQIDFGKAVTVNEITMHTANDDYFRHYQLRLSNKSEDFAAAILKEGDGMKGTITATLPQPHAGQYLTIRQTGKVMTTWWSLYEVSVACK